MREEFYPDVLAKTGYFENLILNNLNLFNVSKI